jgi:hypothetical protein
VDIKAIESKLNDGLWHRPIECDSDPLDQLAHPVGDALHAVHADKFGRLWVYVHELKHLRMIFDPRDAPS